MRILALFIFLFFTSQSTNAQKLRFGMEVGQNVSTLRIGDLKFQSSLKGSYHAGATLSYNFLGNFRIQSGLSFMRQAFDGVEDGRVTYYVYNLNNLLIPIDITYSTPFGLSLGLGVYGAYNISHQRPWYPDCIMGNPEVTVMVYDQPTMIGSRYSISMDVLKKKSFDMGLSLRHFNELISNQERWVTVNAKLTSLSLFINYKGGRQIKID